MKQDERGRRVRRLFRFRVKAYNGVEATMPPFERCNASGVRFQVAVGIGCLMLSFLVVNNFQAQFPGRGTFGGGGGESATNPVTGEDVELYDDVDSTGVSSYYADAPGIRKVFGDSLLHARLAMYDPIYTYPVRYSHLGLVGSAAYPLFFAPQTRQGFDAGYHAYDLYRLTAEKVAFYRTGKAYTDLRYTITGEQNDAVLQTKFGRNFEKGVGLSVDFTRLSQLSDLNHYPNQNLRNTAFGTGVSIEPEGKPYRGFLVYSFNKIQQNENGGITREPATDGILNTPSSDLVNTTQAETNHQDQELRYTHYITIGGKTDTATGKSRQSLQLKHTISYLTAEYAFEDLRVSDTSTFYRGFAPVDSNVLFVQNNYRSLRNAADITWQLPATQALEGRRFISAGAKHMTHYLEQQDSFTTRVQDVFLTGKLRFALNENTELKANAHLGVLGHPGDYRVDGTLNLGIRKWANLEAGLVSQLSSPTQLEERFYSNYQPVWNNTNLKKTLATSITGKIEIPFLRLQALGGVHVLNNYIYFDSSRTPQQIGEAFSVLQVAFSQHTQWKGLHVVNHITLQQSTNTDVVRLPLWYSNHQVYLEDKWFKQRLNIQIGGIFHLQDTYFSNTYFPAINQFYIQQRSETLFYPGLDVYVAMRVTRFRAFAVYENLPGLWKGDTLFYQTAFYPNQFGGIRFGVSWRLVN